MGYQIIDYDGLAVDQLQAFFKVAGRTGKGPSESDFHVVQPSGINADHLTGRRSTENIEGAAFASQLQIRFNDFGDSQGGDYRFSAFAIRYFVD